MNFQFERRISVHQRDYFHSCDVILDCSVGKYRKHGTKFCGKINELATQRSPFDLFRPLVSIKPSEFGFYLPTFGQQVPRAKVQFCRLFFLFQSPYVKI